MIIILIMVIGIPDPTDLGNMTDYILQILHDSVTKTIIWINFSSSKMKVTSLPAVTVVFCHMCVPVRKKSGRSSLALAVWNSSLSLNLHSSSSSSLPTVCLKELRSALMTHKVAPVRRGGRGMKRIHVAQLDIQNKT